MPFRGYFILGLLLALSACSKKNEDVSSPAEPLVRTIHTSTSAEANKLFRQTSLTCADSAQCPPAVGMLVAKQGSDVLTCTAFLLGEGLVATNSHCIPSAVKLSPPLCAERVKLILPATGGLPEESIACETLVEASSRPNDFSPDLALIRLARKTNRAALPVTHEGLRANAPYLAYKVNPRREQAGLPTGELVAETCTPVMNSYLFPAFRSGRDSVFTSDCVAKPGNSGSPLVDGEGRVVGLLQALLRLSEAQNDLWLPYLEAGENAFAPLSLGTNMTCLGEGKISEACFPLTTDDVFRPPLASFLEAAEIQAETASVLHKYFAQPSDFRWARAILKKSSLERTEQFEPGCILNSAGTDPALSEALVPTFRIKLSFNRYLQASAHAELLREERQAFRFSRFDLTLSGETKVENSAGKFWTLSECGANLP